MNQKKNKHFQETDERIQKVLLDIVNEQKSPTVAEICRRAAINRTTFYLHYTDIIDLLKNMQASIFKSFTESIEEDDKDVRLMSFRSYELFAQHVQKNKDFYRLYFKTNTSFPLKDGYDLMWETILLPYFHEHGIYDEDIMRLRFVCFQAGFTITLGKWVEQNCNISCEEIAEILCNCITL